jgi:hypothetical protein
MSGSLKASDIASINGKTDIQLTLTDDAPGIGVRGQVVRLALTPADVHDATENPTLLAGFSNADMRADEASPVILVDQDHDKYRTFSESNVFRRVNVKGSLQGAIPEVDPISSLTSYSVVDRFLGSFIPDPTEKQATAYRPRVAALRRIAAAIALDREFDVWDMLMLAANWDANNVRTLNGTTKWNVVATSDPILDLQQMLERSLQQVTDVWFNQRVAHVFLNHPKVQAFIKLFNGDRAIEGTLKDVSDAQRRGRVDFTLLGLPFTFHVSAAKAEATGSTAIDYILGNDVVGTSRLDTLTDEETITTSTTFRRKLNAGVGYTTREFRIENRGPHGGTMVVAAMADRAVMRSGKVGFLIDGAYAP